MKLRLRGFQAGGFVLFSIVPRAVDATLAAGIGAPRILLRRRGRTAMRVLLVEDDYATAQSMELMMRSEGINVYMTDLGEEAVELPQLYNYDVVLLDICLPDMSGYQVLRAWRAAGVTTPVLVVTGAADDEAHAYEHGADGFYAKPFHKDELVSGMFTAVRKASGNPALVTIGKLRVDTEAKRAMMGKARLFISGLEYRALELMALSRGRAVNVVELGDYAFASARTEERDEQMDKVMRTLMLKLRLASDGREYIWSGWPGIYYWARGTEGE
jgi:two-component system, cell cycle response regulator CtrA